MLAFPHTAFSKHTHTHTSVQVKRTGGATGEGYVPASYVKKLRAGSIGEGPDPDSGEATATPASGSDADGAKQSDLASEAAATQAELTAQYDRVLALFAERQKSLEEAIAYHDFVFEAAELEIWVEERLRMYRPLPCLNTA